jgi:hypothetical protein
MPKGLRRFMAVANDTSSLAVVTVASSSWDRHIAAMCFSKSWTKSDSNMTRRVGLCRDAGTFPSSAQ